jgi:subtilisin family serine protease
MLVQPRAGVEPTLIERLHSRHGVGVRRTFPGLGNLQVLTVPPGRDIGELIRGYQGSGWVEFAEPDYRVRAAGTAPNDPRFLDGTLWGLHNTGQGGGTVDADIDAPEGWDIRTSASNVVVAVLDTGIRATHEDLADNLWVHPVDGGHGWNALTDGNDPVDDEGHGSLVSGIIGASGNNGKGVVGVAWDVQLMACKCLDSSGQGSLSDLIACIDYARANGAHLINASLVVEEFSLALSNAVAQTRAAGILFVASSGNAGTDLDVRPVYPACFDCDNLVCVAYSTRNDQLGSQSNYGATQVDLVAPGQAMYSTFWVADNFYLGGSYLSGSSFAAPYVTGALALLRAKYPLDTHQQIIARLLEGVDPVSALAGKCGTGGRLNLRNALSPPVRLTPGPSVPGDPFRLRVTGGPDRVFVLQTTTDFRQWTPVLIDTTGSDGYYDYVEPAFDRTGQRFYRASALP